MRVILFIGHHKVGSTSLQDFLSRNSVALARAGILYPRVDFEGMSLVLATAAGRFIPGLEALPINAREPHNALAFKMLAECDKAEVPSYHRGLPASVQMIRAIRQQVEFMAPHTVILAAEVFANFAPADPALITRLRQILPNAEFTVIATLRRIDQYLASWHGQRLKFGHKPKPLRNGGLQGYFNNIHFDYQLMLKGWIDSLPDTRFILREYGNVRASGGSVADFVAQAGLDLPDDLVPEVYTNESLHRGVYEIARQGNAALGSRQAGKLRNALRDFSPDLGLPPSGDVELFGARNRQIMSEQFESIHDYIGTVAGGMPFFPDQDEVMRLCPVPEQDAFRQALSGMVQRKAKIGDPEIADFLTAMSGDISE